MDSPLDILLFYMDCIASEGLIPNVGFICDIMMIHCVSCHMHGRVLIFVFHICLSGNLCSGYRSSFMYSLDWRSCFAPIIA